MKKQTLLKFTKMSGAGNDFIVINGDDLELNTEIVKKLCDRHNGIGADGILEITESRLAAFKLRYFNADGSEGFLCLNGSRCAVMYAYKKKLNTNTEVEYEYLNKIFKAKVIDDRNVEVNVSPPKRIKTNLKISLHLSKITAHYVDIGSEHLIIFCEENPYFFENRNIFLADLDVFNIGREIRWLPQFLPNGVNVNFVKIISDNELEIRTYERGVENETLACGSGSVSSALVSHLIFRVNPPIILNTFGGDCLTVGFDIEGQVFKDISIMGPAKITFEGEIFIND